MIGGDRADPHRMDLSGRHLHADMSGICTPTSRSNGKIVFTEALSVWNKIRKCDPIPTGNAMLDTILDGGLVPGLRHFIHAPAPLHTPFLQDIAVRYCSIHNMKVAYVDGLNSFDTYTLSKVAINLHLSPAEILDRIMVSRAFNHGQITEILGRKIENLGHIGIILIAGLTNALSNTDKPESIMDMSYQGNIFRKLKEIFSGLDRAISNLEERYGLIPTVVATGSHHPASQRYPMGGNLLKHYFNVIIGIYNNGQKGKGHYYTDYILQQHPFIPARLMRKWHPSAKITEYRKQMGRKKTGSNGERADALPLRKVSYIYPLERYISAQNDTSIGISGKYSSGNKPNIEGSDTEKAIISGTLDFYLEKYLTHEYHEYGG